jgi:poly(glycerol-phosphate) alpha-glucosyltransferase
MVRAVSGGQTRAMLQRSCAISKATERPADVLTIDAFSEYDQLRRHLHDSGLLSGGMRLLNLYEHYRVQGWGAETGTGEQLEAPSGLDAVEISHPDGSPWRKAYLDATRQVVLNDFLRPDGTVFLRAAPYHIDSAEQLPRELIRVAPDGEVVGRFSSLGQWCRRWVAELTRQDDRTFLFTDSRQLLPVLAPIDDPSTHLIFVLHNCHVPAPRRWDTPLHQQYRRCLEALEHADAFVTLTQRQRDDIERRWGPRNNMAVVPNVVDLPDIPTPAPPREPHQVVLLARLEKQKRIAHALRVMQRVVREVPDARLDIYGTGKLQHKLQAEIEQRGLGGHATLRGHDPVARERLWSASAFLFTSESEGYPLSTLESMSRGCPVVSYDIPYGPREQITDGVEGFLVADGDIAAAAERVIRLLSSPQLVAQFGLAGRVRAGQHSKEAFLDNWADVLNAVVERAQRRTRLTSTNLSLSVTTLRTRPFGITRLRLRGDLRFTGTTRGPDPGEAVLSLVLVDETTGSRTLLPLTTRYGDCTFDFEATLDLDRISAELSEGRHATLRLCLRWENSYWETTVSSERPLRGRSLDRSAAGVIVVRSSSPQDGARADA